MGKILNFPKHKLMANLAGVPHQSKPEANSRVREDHSKYGDESFDSAPPQFTLTDDKSIYAYYQLTQATKQGKTLDRAARLKSAAIANTIKTVHYKQISKTVDLASSTEKGRASILLNESRSEKPQRFINCLSASTYICPHKNESADQWNLINWLTGEFDVLYFDEQGFLIQRIEMSDKENRIVEIPAHVYHTFIAREPCSYLEIRNSAYQPKINRAYANWAPPENSPQTLTYMQHLLSAEVGDKITMEEFDY